MTESSNLFSSMPSKLSGLLTRDDEKCIMQFLGKLPLGDDLITEWERQTELEILSLYLYTKYQDKLVDAVEELSSKSDELWLSLPAKDGDRRLTESDRKAMVGVDAEYQTLRDYHSRLKVLDKFFGRLLKLVDQRHIKLENMEIRYRKEVDHEQ